MGNYNNWYNDDAVYYDMAMEWAREVSKQTSPTKKRCESYTAKVNRLAKAYPAVAEAKAHLDALMVLVENGK